MSKVEILEKLIAHYEYSIKVLCSPLRTKKRFFHKMSTHKTDRGICFCSLFQFETNILLDDWVKRHELKDTGYWMKPPYLAETKAEAIELLKKRVYIMKTEILIP